jgi:ankyrin repeat protein
MLPSLTNLPHDAQPTDGLVSKLFVSKQEKLDYKLLKAVLAGDRNRVNDLLAKGASVDAADGNDKTALMWACDLRRPLMVEDLLRKGANTRLKSVWGKTARDYAVGQPNILALLR